GRRSWGSPAIAGFAERVGRGTGRLLRRCSTPSRFCRAAPDNSELWHSSRSVRKFVEGVSSGSDNYPLSDFRRSPWLLRELCQSGRQAGALCLRVLRSAAARAVGLHLHGSTARKFLAGRIG